MLRSSTFVCTVQLRAGKSIVLQVEKFEADSKSSLYRTCQRWQLKALELSIGFLELVLSHRES